MSTIRSVILKSSTALNINMIAKYIVLSNIITSVFHQIVFCVYIFIQESLLILKKNIVLLHIWQHITAYSSITKFTRLIPAWDPGNVCVQIEDKVKPMKTFDPPPCRKNPIKIKLSYQIVSPYY